MRPLVPNSESEQVHYLGRSSAASVITRSCRLSWFGGWPSLQTAETTTDCGCPILRVLCDEPALSEVEGAGTTAASTTGGVERTSVAPAASPPTQRTREMGHPATPNHCHSDRSRSDGDGEAEGLACAHAHSMRDQAQGWEVRGASYSSSSWPSIIASGPIVMPSARLCHCSPCPSAAN